VDLWKKYLSKLTLEYERVNRQTLAILKPDCIEKNLTGKVIDDILHAGFKIRAARLVRLTVHQAESFYKVHREQPFFHDLVTFMTSGVCIPMVLEKENAVEDFRKTIGATDPKKADPGTIRYKYADNIQSNIVHGSDSLKNAEKEIAFFFSKQEIIANF
jgi:nucleoside-diphosphate kinase